MSTTRIRFLAGRSHEVGSQDLLEGRMRHTMALDEFVELLRRHVDPLGLILAHLGGFRLVVLLRLVPDF